MKKIEAIIRPSALEAVCTALSRRGIDGLSVSQVAGAGREAGQTAHYRGASYRVDLLPRLRVEVVTTDVQARPVAVTILEAARTGHVGDGLIIITSVEEAVRIRTAERGASAISDDESPDPAARERQRARYRRSATMATGARARA